MIVCFLRSVTHNDRTTNEVVIVWKKWALHYIYCLQIILYGFLKISIFLQWWNVWITWSPNIVGYERGRFLLRCWKLIIETVLAKACSSKKITRTHNKTTTPRCCGTLITSYVVTKNVVSTFQYFRGQIFYHSWCTNYFIWCYIFSVLKILCKYFLFLQKYNELRILLMIS